MPGADTGRPRGHALRAALAAAAAIVLAIAGDTALARRKPPPDIPALSLPADLFGAGEVAHPPATDFAKWTETMARYEREQRQEKALCDEGECALVRWREFLETLRGQEALAQLRAVNAYLNRLPYKTDLENYGAEDYWATPRQLFARGGDCEDYAIAKLLSLKALGWPAERLRVAVVHDNARDLVHAVLVAYHGGHAYVLDIEITEVTDHRNIARYVPIFSIGENGWWSFRALPPAEVAKAVGEEASAAVKPEPKPEKPAWRSLHLIHKPVRGAPPPRLTAPARAEGKHAAHWRSPHIKHNPPRFAKIALRPAPPPAPAVPAVVLDVLKSAAREPGEPQRPAAQEPEAVAEPGERIEEMFLPGAK